MHCFLTYPFQLEEASKLQQVNISCGRIKPLLLSITAVLDTFSEERKRERAERTRDRERKGERERDGCLVLSICSWSPTRRLLKGKYNPTI